MLNAFYAITVLFFALYIIRCIIYCRVQELYSNSNIAADIFLKIMEEPKMLVNIMEEIIKHKVDDIMSEYPTLCKCELCRTDVMARALNSLPPRYVSQVPGNIYTQFDLYSEQNQANIISALIEAIKLVQSHPRHVIQKGEVQEYKKPVFPKLEFAGQTLEDPELDELDLPEPEFE